MKSIELHLRFLLCAGTVALCAGAAVPGAAAAAPPIGAYTTHGAYGYVSEPNLHPPKLAVDAPVKSGKLSPGYWLLANFKNLGVINSKTKLPVPMVGQGGPLIMDKNLQPVWFKPVPTNVFALNLTTQRYNGKPALSWWQGVISSTGAVSSGKLFVVDQRYKQVATLTGKDGWVVSPHEALISGHNVWVTAYRNQPMDLTLYGGLANGVLTDSAVQEYDLRSGALVYSWDAAAPGHIPLSESRTVPSPVPVNGAVIPWDAYHVNSIQLLGGHDFLVSMRNTWTAYEVDRTTGNIVWRLGGNSSSFTVPSNAAFEWQHDVRLQSGNVVTMFDNGCCGIKNGAASPPDGPTRALVIKLDMTHHSASLVSQYSHHKLVVGTQGNVQLQHNGNVVVGWGQQPYFSEYSKSGQTLLDVVLPSPNESYRAYLSGWVGKPYFPPSGAAKTVKSKRTVYASWDGATQVVSWRVLGGKDAKHLASIATQRKSGFETGIRIAHPTKVYEVQALDSKGKVLGTSKAFPRAGGHNTSPTGFY